MTFNFVANNPQRLKVLIFGLGVICAYTSLIFTPYFFDDIVNLLPEKLYVVFLQYSLFFVIAAAILRIPRAAFYPIPDHEDPRPLPIWAVVAANFVAIALILFNAMSDVNKEEITRIYADIEIIRKLESKEPLSDEEYDRTAQLSERHILPSIPLKMFDNNTLKKIKLSEQQQNMASKQRNEPEYILSLLNTAAFQNLDRLSETRSNELKRTVKRLLETIILDEWIPTKIVENANNGILKSPKELRTYEAQLKSVKQLSRAIHYLAAVNSLPQQKIKEDILAAMQERLNLYENNYWQNYDNLKEMADRHLEESKMNFSERLGQAVGKVAKRTQQVGSNVIDAGSDYIDPAAELVDDFIEGVKRGLAD